MLRQTAAQDDSNPAKYNYNTAMEVQIGEYWIFFNVSNSYNMRCTCRGILRLTE